MSGVRQAVLEFAEPIPERLPERFAAFLEFHRSNPQVYGIFREMSLRAKRRGDIGIARDIWIEIRRCVQRRQIALVSTEGQKPTFRLNDHHQPYYTRLVMLRVPELDGYFRIKDANFDTTADELLRKADDIDGARF